jgi:hypothetical protein
VLDGGEPANAAVVGDPAVIPARPVREHLADRVPLDQRLGERALAQLDRARGGDQVEHRAGLERGVDRLDPSAVGVAIERGG